MKKAKIILVLALVLALLCGYTQTQPAGLQSFGSEETKKAFWEGSWFYIEPIQVEHGEDRVIEWADEGMEARVRFWLDKPEGEIYASDIWNIQVIHISYGTDYDVILEEVPDGYDCFSLASIQFIEDQRMYLDGTDLPEIHSLEDLRYFDSLQSLQISYYDWEEPVKIDLSYLTECQHLRALRLEKVHLDDLKLISQIPQLDWLDLSFCSIQDLSPLESCSKLYNLQLSDCEIASLEPIANMPQLQSLSLDCSTYPSLEPLAESNIRFLTLFSDENGRNDYDELDYEPLTRMKQLWYLDLTNHSKADLSLCSRLVESCPELAFLDITYTEAAEEIKAGATLDVSGLKGFDCKPYSN